MFWVVFCILATCQGVPRLKPHEKIKRIHGWMKSLFIYNGLTFIWHYSSHAYHSKLYDKTNFFDNRPNTAFPDIWSTSGVYIHAKCTSRDRIWLLPHPLPGECRTDMCWLCGCKFVCDSVFSLIRIAPPGSWRHYEQWLAGVINVINHHLPQHIRSMCIIKPPAKVKIMKSLWSFPSKWQD